MVVRILFVVVLGALLTYFGVQIPHEQVGDAVGDVVAEVVQKVTSSPHSNQSKQTVLGTHDVLSVIDGDTFTIFIGDTKETVRVLGIDTPETKYSSAGADCFGAEATEHARTLLEGTTVQLTADSSQDARDIYNRILAFITLPDGRDFGQVMIADGYAYEYTFKGNAHENQTLYVATETRAQRDGVGMWEDEVCR